MHSVKIFRWPRVGTWVNLAALVLLLSAAAGHAQEKTIRKNLTERYPALPAITSITQTKMPGIYEVRISNDLFYTDAKADFIFEGDLIDTKAQQNLTALRKEKFQEIPFAKLPLVNAFTLVNGTGQRQMAVFADPNCGFCKRLENELINLKNVTIHYFLLPVLGDDSHVKSGQVWCAKDKVVTWHDWMIRGTVPPQVANCDPEPILSKNIEFARQNRIGGTPTMVFANGKRVAGVLSVEKLEQHLKEAQ